MKAFSLIEVLFSILIFSIISASLFLVFNYGQASWNSSDALITLHQQIRQSIFMIEKDLRQASTTQPVPNQLSNTLPLDNNWYNSVTFNIPTVDVNNNFNGWSTNITYSVNNIQQITRAVQGGVTDVIADNIQFLQFRRDPASPNLIQINITARKTTFLGRVLNDNINSSVAIRN